MPIEQICTIVSAEKLNEFAWSFTLEAGDLVKREGLRAGQFLHVKCGAEHLLRRPISVCLAQADEPVDLVRIVFEVRGEGTAWLSRRKAGDRLSVLAPLGNGFECGERTACCWWAAASACRRCWDRPPIPGGVPLPCWAFAARSGRCWWRTSGKNALRSFCAATTEVWGITALWMSRCGGSSQRIRRLRLSWPVDPSPCCARWRRRRRNTGCAARSPWKSAWPAGSGPAWGCAIRMADGTMKHVCKDGPVFEAEEVDWNV